MSDAVTRLNAALEGRYTIERELGEGGMATVYLAKDLKHNRDVALKVLKPELAAVVGAERFLAEIETTANLKHPHILPLFDSGEADSFLFYVMPYLEGETLQDRIDREKQLPVDEAVRIATAVANALDHAHRHKVIHRDIKPANILLQDGEPVIADFGIALAVGAAGGGRLTETGLSVGTPHYMSPEQATGDQTVGAATDIYALAAVLYEMLVGDPPYVGSTAQAILGKIIAGKVASATEERTTVPANVDAAIRCALEKLPADRFTGAQDFAKALADPGFRYGEIEHADIAATVGPWKRIAVTFVGLFVAASGVAGWALLRPDPPLPVERFSLSLAGNGSPGVSPDGSSVVFSAPGDGGGRQLWLRRWESLAPTPIPGTGLEGVVQPVISLTGDEVAFIVGGQLKVAPLSGGVVRTLADSAYCCSRWGPDGFIYFSGGADRHIKRVPVTGGAIEVVTRREEEQDGQHTDFQMLPGGEVGVFTVWEAPPFRIEAIRISTGERKVLTPGFKSYVTPTGHLVFASQAGEILAAPFDAENMELTGAAVPLVEGVSLDANAYPIFSLSESGALVYLTGSTGGLSEFVWVDRSGQETPVDQGYTFTLPINWGLRLSPDETRVVFNSVVDGNNDVRIKHLPDGPEERITFSEDIDYRPLWTPDGQTVTYFSGPSAEDRNVWSRRADGTGEAVLLLDDERSLNHGSWSPDGEWLVLRAAATQAMGLGLRDVLAFRPGVDSAAIPLVASPDFAEVAPAVSPDGGWLAYSSNETGRDEVFVRPFPNTDSMRVRVSTDGGIAPVWAKSGRELFFVGADRTMVAAQFDPASGRVLDKETLFSLPVGYPAVGANSFYDVSSDGERFLMVRPYVDDTQDEASAGWVLVQNFFEVLKARVPN